MNILVDTNVLLSAALRDRLPEQVVLHIASDNACRWLITDEILLEYAEVLRRPKFAIAPELIEKWIQLVASRTLVVSSPSAGVPSVRDPRDAIFLAAALSANADFLISGDKDLLQASVSIATRIISVADFAAEFQIRAF